MTLLAPPPAALQHSTGSVPTCEECAVALQPAGAGRHRYWTCAHCGATVPRA